MKRKTLVNLLMVFGLALLLTGGILMVRQVWAQEGSPQGKLDVQSAVGTAFTYQGRLLSGNTAVSNTCDFRFNLYDDNGFSSILVAGPVDRGSVTVSDGYFSTSIDFGSDAFTGEGRQLEIAVRCPAGSGSYTTLSGMVMLNAAPYAHSLRPGAGISGSLGYLNGAILNVNNTYDGILNSYGIHGTSQGIGVLGTGDGTGVQGETAATSGYGVYGAATSSSGVNYGVYGETNSPTGHGVYGTIAANNPLYAGVTGANTGTGTGSGVYGFSIGGYGVYGRSTGNKAIYSDGDAHVEGNLTWKVITSYVSISTAAFIPELLNDAGHVAYDNEGYYLKNESGDSEWFVAPVQLPHGATVTGLDVGWRDGSNTQATVYLRRRSMLTITATSEILAQVNSRGSFFGPQEGVWSDDTIDNAAIDNKNYTYYLDVGMHDSSEDIQLKGVVIEYTLTKPY